jgi:mono/diheme cytochrome c family protein
MKRVLRWLAGSIAVVLVLAVAGIFGMSEYALRRAHEAPAESVRVVPDSATLARGAHIAVTRGCTGCHGPDLGGTVFHDEPNVARLVAPNLTAIRNDYSDADFVRLLRHGVRPNGEGVVVMPSSMYRNLSDEDLGAVIAYLRSVPAVSDSLPPTSVRILGRLGLALGKFQTEPERIAAANVEPMPTPAAGDTVGTGRYIVMSTCAECHGLKLEGDEMGTPGLSVVAAYSVEAFTTLMRTGKPVSGRDLDLMDDVARSRFAHFSDAEIAAMYAYLRSFSGAKTTAVR